MGPLVIGAFSDETFSDGAFSHWGVSDETFTVVIRHLVIGIGTFSDGSFLWVPIIL